MWSQSIVQKVRNQNVSYTATLTVACNVQAATYRVIFAATASLSCHLPAEHREANLASHSVVWQVAKIKYRTNFVLYIDIDFV
jgi:hypothetical protein